MIIGWSTVNIKQAQLQGYKCPICQYKSSVLAILSSYFSFYWIPMFPYRKRAKIVCMECQHEQVDENMPSELQEKVLQMKSSVKSPWWMYIGLIILLFMVVFFTTVYY